MKLISSQIKDNINRLKNKSHQREQVIKDYSINGITVKNVPFIMKDSEYLLAGRTLDRIYTLLLENENKQKTIYFH